MPTVHNQARSFVCTPPPPWFSLIVFFLFHVRQIKHVVLQMAGYVSPDLREWVETNTTFPNTMVDRITPMTEAEHIELVARYLSI